MINSDSKGLLPLSHVQKSGDRVIINKGPLKNLTGRILYYIEKKRKCAVELQLFNKTIKVNLGIDLLETKKVPVDGHNSNKSYSNTSINNVLEIA